MMYKLNKKQSFTEVLANPMSKIKAIVHRSLMRFDE